MSIFESIEKKGPESAYCTGVPIALMICGRFLQAQLGSV